jgi:hypothetical protein
MKFPFIIETGKYERETFMYNVPDSAVVDILVDMAKEDTVEAIVGEALDKYLLDGENLESLEEDELKDLIGDELQVIFDNNKNLYYFVTDVIRYDWQAEAEEAYYGY